MSSWPSAQLGALVDPVSTWSPGRDAVEETFTYIDLSAVDQDRKTITAPRLVAGRDAPSRARQLVRADDILVSTVRPNLNAAARVPVEMGGATASTGFCVLRPRADRLDAGYLFHWVRSPRFVREMTKLATGASYPAVSDRIVLDSHLPLPPLVQQRRIAAILDQADALRAKRRTALAQLDALAKSIFIDMFGDPATNPKGLKRRGLAELFDISRGGSPRPIDAYLTDDPNGVNWVLIGDAPSDGKYITATKKRITRAGAERSRAVKIGDFILTNSMSFGRPYVMRTSGCIHDGWLALSPRATGLNIDYFYALLGSPSMYAEFARRAPGATVKNLNIDLVRTVAVPVAPPTDQEEYSRATVQIERLEAPMRASLLALDALFASLQHRAFHGEL